MIERWRQHLPLPLFNFMNMIDNNFTNEIISFLNIEKPSDDDIRHGAELLLRINRNRMLWQNILRRPQRMLAKLTYELNKHLKPRLNGMTLQDVKKFDKETMTNIEDTLHNDVPEDLETENVDADDGSTIKRHGKRADHDSLPVAIQALWENNKERWKKLKELYYKCCDAADGCDRYEDVVQLADGYEHYKADMIKYDSWQPGEQSKIATDAKDLGNARAYISKYRKVYEQLVDNGDTDKAAALHDKIQERVTLLTSNNADISPELGKWLADNNFSIDGPSGYTETSK